MQIFKKWYIRLAGFLVLFLCVNSVLDLAFLPVNRLEYLVMNDYRNAEKVDIVIIGDSCAGADVDPLLMEELTGQTAFDLFNNNARMDELVFLSRIAMEKKPSTIVLLVPPDIAVNEKEPLESFYSAAPFSTGVFSRIEYAVAASRHDGFYLDRFFPWRQSFLLGIKNPKGLQINVMSKIIPNYLLSEATEAYSTGEYQYRYHGHTVRSREKDENEIIAAIESEEQELQMNALSISATLQSNLMKLKRICEHNDCELIIATQPYDSRVFAAGNTNRQATDTLKEYCIANNITFLDFNNIKNEYMDNIDPYVLDSGGHLSPEGAELFTESLVKLIQMRNDGVDVMSCFE